MSLLRIFFFVFFSTQYIILETCPIIHRREFEIDDFLIIFILSFRFDNVVNVHIVCLDEVEGSITFQTNSVGELMTKYSYSSTTRQLPTS